VVQKHDATRLHYDFRLELDGVLKSWAVPKGPSLDPAVKRLAVETEDHPLEYGSFEGVIPKGAYGAGPVIVWDRGRWIPKGNPRDGYRRGRLEFSLEGEKLRGAWLLLKLQGRSDRDARSWLLVKRHDGEAREGAKADLPTVRPESVRTGRRIESLVEGREPEWESNRTEHTPRGGAAARAARRPKAPARRARRESPGPRPPTPSSPGASRQARAAGRTLAAARLPGAREAPLPKRFGAQLCTLVSAAPPGPEWIHEIKFDGYRILCRIHDGRAELISRNGKDWTERFPGVAVAAARLPVKEALLDGEVARFDERGRTSFQALQAALTPGTADDFVYCVFDLLHLNGYDLAAVPLLERKRALASLLGRGNRAVLRYSDHVVGGGPEFHAAACEQGLEGIVSKRADGHHAAVRTREWLKVRCGQRQELVVVGFTPHSADREAVGALLLGVHDGGKGLRYAGKVGTGFSDKVRQDLKRRLERDVRTAPAPVAAPRVPGAVWVSPRLVAEVSFTEWTKDGFLRHPSFQGLREDKEPKDVVKEAPKPPPSPPTSWTARSRAPEPKASAKAGPSKSSGPRHHGTGDASFLGVRLSHPDRVLWPDGVLTKAHLAAYYVEIAPWVLAEVEGRPLTLVRCPAGQGKPCFFQKHPSGGVPEGLTTVAIRESEGKEPYFVLERAEGLVALVQMGAMELHTWGARADDVERPDRIVLDLDPDPSVPFRRVIDAARALRQRLEAAGLAAFVKTTGGKGLHVVAPLLRRYSWDQVKDVARAFAEGLVQDEPGAYISKASKAARRGKIFIDWLRNGRGATAIASYSARARPGAPVSVPLAWDELDHGLNPADFTIESVPKRLRSLSHDPWAGYKRSAKGLGAALDL
jgi:bifunctional non-homologous end joining protein LigD